MTMFRHHLFSVLFFTALLGVGGCASGGGGGSISDDVLAQRAALSLGVAPDQVIISNRGSESSMGSTTIHFTATVNGEDNRCFIETAYFGMMKTSAVCSGPRGSVGCNELRRAAGQC